MHVGPWRGIKELKTRRGDGLFYKVRHLLNDAKPHLYLIYT